MNLQEKYNIDLDILTLSNNKVINKINMEQDINHIKQNKKESKLVFKKNKKDRQLLIKKNRDNKYN